MRIRLLPIRSQSLLALLLLLPSFVAAEPQPVAVPGPVVSVRWREASGPVAGYAVYVARNGGEARLEQYVATPPARVIGAYGERLEVEVVPFDAEGNLGPSSPRSAPFQLLHPLLDPDEDGWMSGFDRCPLHFDPEQTDRDADGFGDACDVCPLVSDPRQGDTDRDGIGNACECGDVSGDGVPNTIDAVLMRLCVVGVEADFCWGLCDVNGDDRCDTTDAHLVQIFAAGELSKSDLLCAERP